MIKPPKVYGLFNEPISVAGSGNTVGTNGKCDIYRIGSGGKFGFFVIRPEEKNGTKVLIPDFSEYGKIVKNE